MTFTDAKFMTAAEKTRVFNAWKRFVKAIAAGDYPATEQAFTKGLYNHLIQHCSFIAHYNQGGFFGTYFVEPEDTIRFFTQFDPDGQQLSVEYGMTYWVKGGNDVCAEYDDLNQAMCEATRPHLSAIRNLSAKRQRDLDVARANALLAKHGQPTV